MTSHNMNPAHLKSPESGEEPCDSESEPLVPHLHNATDSQANCLQDNINRHEHHLVSLKCGRPVGLVVNDRTDGIMGVRTNVNYSDIRAVEKHSSTPDVVRSFEIDCSTDCNGFSHRLNDVSARHDVSPSRDFKSKRRVSSGDTPLWLSQDLKNGINGPNLVELPAHIQHEEGFLIGRASNRGDAVQLMRVTRLTEVAPTHSSIVDVEDEKWKIPLEMFTSKKKGNEIKHYKSRRIRSYYKAQDELISAYEDVCVSQRGEEEIADTELSKRQRLIALRFSQATLCINLMLMSAKLAASILSGSMSIISSLVDSVVDLLSGIIMWWASRAMRKRNPYSYPQGRTKLEPVSIIILSVVMALASIQLIRESAEKLASLADKLDIVSQDTSFLPLMEISTFVIAGSTIVIKFIMWVIYRRVNISTVQALALDARNDVMSNSVAIVCGYLGSKEFQDKFDHPGFIFVDPIGAILISCYIIFNWYRAGKEQIKMLTGHTARPDFLSKLTWVTMNHDEKIRHIDTVRAFHFGNDFLVEVDIVLPESMSLKVAHDIGETLQQKLETLPEVERAFVHLDYEVSHDPTKEHKSV